MLMNKTSDPVWLIFGGILWMLHVTWCRPYHRSSQICKYIIHMKICPYFRWHFSSTHGFSHHGWQFKTNGHICFEDRLFIRSEIYIHVYICNTHIYTCIFIYSYIPTYIHIYVSMLVVLRRIFLHTICRIFKNWFPDNEWHICNIAK